ncbi:MAG: BrnA antitoxin family protein [Deltaproteobacteria bacterium]|nr:BrnA antitoxin family protein [Deltaproteobacteria bacterium]
MSRKKQRKPLPRFRTEREERAFWQTHDSTDYVDYARRHRVTIEFDHGVEEPVKLISIRLPRDMLIRLRAMAVKRDVPYQSLIKMILAEKLEKQAA